MSGHQEPIEEADMAGQGHDKGENARRAAESAAKVVLAKHPTVVAGVVQPVVVRAEVRSPPALDIGTRNIGRGLQR